MNHIFDWLNQHLPDNTWIIQVFVVILAAAMFNFFLRRILARMQKQLEKTDTYWDDAVIEAVRAPLRLLVWIVGIAFASEIIRLKTGAVLFNAVGPARDVGIIMTITWFAIRLVARIETKMIARREVNEAGFDRTTVDAISKLVRASLVITAVLVILQTLGFSISGVLAFGGIGGIAIGFAAKDLLANFFGGLMIYLDRPFSVGDWIRSPDREIEGTVERIGWRQTMIRTFDKRPLYVPNATFANIAVENPSRMSHRRIYERIGIRYDDIAHMQAITDAVKMMLRKHEEIDKSQTMIVNFDSFAPSSVDFFVYTFTHTTNWVRFHEIKQDVLLKIADIIAKHGAEIAFPTSTIHLATSPAEPDHPGDK